jgi:hypothetical protein
MACVTCEQGTLGDAAPWSGRSAEAVLRKEGKMVVFDGKAESRLFQKGRPQA